MTVLLQYNLEATFHCLDVKAKNHPGPKCVPMTTAGACLGARGLITATSDDSVEEVPILVFEHMKRTLTLSWTLQHFEGLNTTCTGFVSLRRRLTDAETDGENPSLTKKLGTILCDNFLSAADLAQLFFLKILMLMEKLLGSEKNTFGR